MWKCERAAVSGSSRQPNKGGRCARTKLCKSSPRCSFIKSTATTSFPAHTSSTIAQSPLVHYTMSLAASRMLLRRPQVGRIGLRHASTTSEAAQAASNTASKAKDTVGSATSSASQGLSKVTSSAGSGLSRAGAAAGSALNSIGGRTGKLIGFVQCMSTAHCPRPHIRLSCPWLYSIMQ